jgi:hypothetical protein
MSAIRPISDLQFGVAHTEIGVIQAPEPGPRIMRYELTDFEWTAIRPFLPNMPARRAEGQRPTPPHRRRFKSHSPEVSDCLTINVRLLISVLCSGHWPDQKRATWMHAPSGDRLDDMTGPRLTASSALLKTLALRRRFSDATSIPAD